MRPTVFTSNLSPTELGTHFLDERLLSRIIAMCGEKGIVEMKGSDYRLTSFRTGV